MLTEKQIKKFQSLYKKRFGKEINKQDAYDQGLKLVRLLEIVYKPLTNEEYKKFNRSFKK
jgi:hypothetical protein